MDSTVQTRSRLFLAHSGWDMVPVLAGLAHLAYLVTVFLLCSTGCRGGAWCWPGWAMLI